MINQRRVVVLLSALLVMLLAACRPSEPIPIITAIAPTHTPPAVTANVTPPPNSNTLEASVYYDKVRGQWLAANLGLYAALDSEGVYIEQPNPASTITFNQLDGWPSDDDTHLEYLTLFTFARHGIFPTYDQITADWTAAVRDNVWGGNAAALDLMAEGIAPPLSGQAAYNDFGAWSIDAQIRSEIFGMLAPGLPSAAHERAVHFARISNEGESVEFAAFYSRMFARAFFDPYPHRIIENTIADLPQGNPARTVAVDVLAWYRDNPDDWRATRQRIYDAHFVAVNAPSWIAGRANFALTLMALLYGNGDFEQTVTIATLAGLDNDCNAATAGGLVGVLVGFSGLPPHLRDSASDVYVNKDLDGVPRFDSLNNIAVRYQAIAEEIIREAGGDVRDGVYYMPLVSN